VSDPGGEPLDPDEPLGERLLRAGVSAEQLDEATEAGSLELLALEHLAIPDLFRYPTVTSLAQFCAAGDIHKSVRQKRNAATRA